MKHKMKNKYKMKIDMGNVRIISVLTLLIWPATVLVNVRVK